MLTMKFRLADARPRRCPRSTTPRTGPAADALAAAAVTVLRGTCGGAGARAGHRHLLRRPGRHPGHAHRRADRRRGAGQASGGTIVHLVGYGDGAKDLRPDAAVTVAMDTPYVLAARSLRRCWRPTPPAGRR